MKQELGTEMQNHVGAITLKVFDEPSGVAIPTYLFYPTTQSPQPHSFPPFTLEVALDAPCERDDLPLLVLSHGTGSSPWLFRDLAAHLARSGFAVALLRHPGNNRGDDALAFTITNLENRPRHVKRVIDAAFADARVGPRLARKGVGIIGHSLGGYTALALAGGRPVSGPNETQDGTFRSLSVAQDSRVRALALLAPATGWFLPEGSLLSVSVPIYLRTGERDELAPPVHGDVVVHGVPDARQVDLKVVPDAGHFSFMSPYPPELKGPQVVPSQDPEGFDREAYQPVLRGEMVEFFQRTLAP